MLATGRDITDEIEIELVVQRRVDRRSLERRRGACSRPAAARTTASVPILCRNRPAGSRRQIAGRSRSDSHCPITRAMISIDPPAGKCHDDAHRARRIGLRPAQCARRPGARQRPPPDAEICGGEVSSSPLGLAKVHSITSSARASSVGCTVRPNRRFFGRIAYRAGQRCGLPGRTTCAPDMPRLALSRSR